MKIVLPGGSGQIGTLLARKFARDGHEVVVLSRTLREREPEEGQAAKKRAWRVRNWDARTVGDWAAELENADVVFNLAGRSVNCRYHDANRRAILESRVNSTRVVGEAIAKAAVPPRLWLQMSTATIYAHRFDAPNDEFTRLVGGSEPGAPDTWLFSIEVATAWERAATEAQLPARTRLVLLRAAMTMSPDAGGIFDTLLRLVRFGLGGTASDGRQFVSWIHEVDFLRAVDWLIAHEEVNGPVNLCAPVPLPNAEFMRALRQASGQRIGLPAARWMLELGALFLRTETELILKSRRVIPGLLQQKGFTFEFPTWPEAARELCERWKSAPST